MEDRELKNRIPCLIEQGIVYNYRDMIRVLRDLGHVRYQELVGETVRAEGEGYVVSVVSSSQSATIIINKRLYINVNGFDYLTLATDSESRQSRLDLVDGERIIRLSPVTDPLAEDQPISVEQVQRDLEEEVLSEEEFAEIYLDDDLNEDAE